MSANELLVFLGRGAVVRGLYVYLRVAVGFGFGAVVVAGRGAAVAVAPIFLPSITSWPFSVYTFTQTLLVQLGSAAVAVEIGVERRVRIRMNLRMA